MPEMAQCKIDEQRQEAVRQMKAAGVDIPRNLEEQALLLVGRDIYEALIKGYTEKQWGRRCCDLPAFIIKRLPLRFTYDNNYFNDRYQGIPIGGYNPLIEGLLSGTMCLNNTDFFADRGYWQEQAEHIVYTGPIDEYFDFQFGKLNYRTLRFEHELIPVANYQGNAVVNFTDRNIPYTRIIEHKHFEMFGDMVYKIPSTIVTREYPSEWQEGFEPYYPVNDDRNDRIATQYKQLAARERSIIFGGRLAEYKYYDMAPIMERAIQINKSL
jgi:UDP-galactopyranose mutase